MLIHFNYKSIKINIINYLISGLPLCFILGNLITNINVVLIGIFGFLIYKEKIFYIKQDYLIYFIYVFFFYLIIITFVNNWPLLEESKLYKEHLIKSIFFCRFLILFLVINKLIDQKKFNINLFIVSCGFFSAIISIDILIQFLFKKNIAGFPILNNKPSSFFKEENIAGGFLQHFILFFIYLIFIKLKKKSDLLISIIFIIFLIPIIVTANRMPALIYAAYLPVYFLIEKKFKKVFGLLIIITSLIFLFSQLTISKRLHSDYKWLIYDSVKIIKEAPNMFINNKPPPDFSWGSGYLVHFNSGIQLWKEKKIFGHGLKSFRLNCTYTNYLTTCNTHPHNYFIELMVDTGLIGIFLIYTTIIFKIVDFFKFHNNERNYKKNFINLTFFLLVFFEFFPIRSSGSFFTTGNATFIFLILSIFFNLKKINVLRTIKNK